MKTPEEILIDIELKEFASFTSNERFVIYSAMQEYGKQQYNQAVKDAAENVEISFPEYLDGNKVVYKCAIEDIAVDKESIFKLLKQ